MKHQRDQHHQPQQPQGEALWSPIQEILLAATQTHTQGKSHTVKGSLGKLIGCISFSLLG